MTQTPQITRRAALASGMAATALTAFAPGVAAQSRQPALRGIVPFAARMRALTGFDPLPRDLLTALHTALTESGAIAPDSSLLEEGRTPNAEQKRAMKALYHGILAPRDDTDSPARRLAYANALQWAAVEDFANVPSYCGGLPGFWADPPAQDEAAN